MPKKIFNVNRYSNVIHAIDPEDPTETMCGMDCAELSTTRLFRNRNVVCVICEHDLTPKNMRIRLITAQNYAQEWDDIRWSIRTFGDFTGKVSAASISEATGEKYRQVSYTEKDMELINRVWLYWVQEENSLKSKIRNMISDEFGNTLSI